MSVHRLVSPLLAVVLAGCGQVSQKLPRSGPDVPRPVAVTGSMDAVARGRVVFDNACTRCHGIEAATDSAPAMREIARRYHGEIGNAWHAAERVADWIVAPATEQALLPAAAAGHRDLMRRVPLDRDLAVDVGWFVWSLGETATRLDGT
jgi:cytochrome c551/c552